MLSVIGTVLLSAVITAVLPEGKTVGVIKGIARLACVLAIVAPILTFLQTKDIGEDAKKTSGNFYKNVIEMDESFIEYYSEARVSQTERALENELKEKYGYDIAVKFTWVPEEEVYNSKYFINGIRVLQIQIKCLEEVTEGERKVMVGYVVKNYCSEVLIE